MNCFNVFSRAPRPSSLVPVFARFLRVPRPASLVPHFASRVPVLTLCLLSLTFPAFAADPPKYQRTIEKYTIPDVVLVNQHGDRVRLKTLLETDKPVIVDFIYGTCTTICPILSAGFANLQRKLGADSERVRLVSFTIDPEHDTPKVLKEYLDRYQAKPGWDFLSGSRKDIDRVMNAFNAYFSNKMDHQPLTFLRTRDGEWVRLYGLIGSRDFMEECRQVGVVF